MDISNTLQNESKMFYEHNIMSDKSAINAKVNLF